MRHCLSFTTINYRIFVYNNYIRTHTYIYKYLFVFDIILLTINFFGRFVKPFVFSRLPGGNLYTMNKVSVYFLHKKLDYVINALRHICMKLIFCRYF